MKNHAEPRPKNFKRSHAVQVMAKHHSGGYPLTGCYILGASSVLNKGNRVFNEGQTVPKVCIMKIITQYTQFELMRLRP